MQAQLLKYFISHGKLPLSGIGTFYLEHVPARLDFAGKKLHPPVQAIRFTLENTTVENKLYDYLQQEFNEDQADVIRRYNDLCYGLKQQLNAQGRILLAGLGWLQKEFLNTYTFTPLSDLATLFRPIDIERIVGRQPEPAMVRQGDHSIAYDASEPPAAIARAAVYWPYIALLLAGLAIATIVYYWQSMVPH